VFDELLGSLVHANEEGRVVARDPDAGPGAAPGVGFTEDNVKRYSSDTPIVPASAALLRLAWEHREVMLG